MDNEHCFRYRLRWAVAVTLLLGGFVAGESMVSLSLILRVTGSGMRSTLLAGLDRECTSIFKLYPVEIKDPEDIHTFRVTVEFF